MPRITTVDTTVHPTEQKRVQGTSRGAAPVVAGGQIAAGDTKTFPPSLHGIAQGGRMASSQQSTQAFVFLHVQKRKVKSEPKWTC